MGYLAEEAVLCAFTVSNASIFTMLLPNARKKKVAKNVTYIKKDLIYPAVLIGRLGISTKFQQHHIGTELMNFIKSWFVDSTNKTGCRYLIVDAYNSDIPLAFYKKNGFDFIFSTEEQEKDYRKIVSDEPLRDYTSRLIDAHIILTNGKGKGTSYSINPLVISSSQSNIQTTLRTIEPYRLKALVMEDLKFHPNSSVQEISSRLPDVDFTRLQDFVRKMARANEIKSIGGRKYRKYSL